MTSRYLKHIVVGLILATSVGCSANPVMAAAKKPVVAHQAGNKKLKSSKVRKNLHSGRKSKNKGKGKRSAKLHKGKKSKHASSKKGRKGKLSAKRGKHVAKKANPA